MRPAGCQGLGAAGFRSRRGPSYGGMRIFTTVMPCFCWLSGVFGGCGGCSVLFWCSLPRCTWVPAAVCALSLGAKGHSGDTQVSPATRVSLWVGDRMGALGGMSCRAPARRQVGVLVWGTGIWGLPSTRRHDATAKGLWWDLGQGFTQPR